MARISSRSSTIIGGLAIVGLILWVYWPATRGGFVWDDKLCFHDSALLHHGNDWMHFVSGGFCDWINYFRPLLVALLALEIHVFDDLPQPMHVVSLGLHAANMLLVALLALRLCAGFASARAQRLFVALVTLVYGLHPALVEPVVWIGCQYELVATLFMLLGLLANAGIRHTLLRALAVSACFLLAAGAKESAAVFPFLLVLFDAEMDRTGSTLRERIRSVWSKQWPVYVAVFAAGIAYLVVRYWALGYLLRPGSGESLPLLSRLQEICLTYLTYWRVLVWPMVGMGPVHTLNEGRIASLSGASIVIDVVALALVLGSFYSFYRRKTVGTLILAMSAALLPVLHLVPIAFDGSFYHERYAMLALAVTCVLLPRALLPVLTQGERPRLFTVFGGVIACLWLGLALVNIRVTLPLWADDLRLWQWALRENPASLVAKDHLISVYVDRRDFAHARELTDALMRERVDCPVCMLNAATMALAEGDAQRAAAALDLAKDSNLLQSQTRLVAGYILATGQLRELQQDLAGAQEAYRDAISLDPFDPRPHMRLALMSLRQGDVAQGRKEGEIALSLMPDDARPAQQRAFEQVLAAAAASATPSP
jgi:tetratricopeptide (TPR) repeat protein